MIKVLGLSLYGTLAASARVRMQQFLPLLKLRGIEMEIHPLLGDDYVKTTFAGGTYSKLKLAACYGRRLGLLIEQGRYEVAMVNAELFPLLPGFLESRLLRIPYVYDFDDAFFLKYRHERFNKVAFLLQDKFDPVLTRAAAVTAGNSYLATYARRWNPRTTILPTVVDTDRYQVAPRGSREVFTVGWIGSPSTSVYLSMMVQPLAELAKTSAVRFVVVGGQAPHIPGVDVQEVPWSEAQEVDVINTFDVGVMPLFDDEWARGKCAFKLIQYMACGVPVVASAVGANVDVVTPDCGMLATNAQQWLGALCALRDNPPARQAMGAASRQRVEDLYSLRSAAKVLGDVIEAAASARR